jgi:hypothetical protein
MDFTIANEDSMRYEQLSWEFNGIVAGLIGYN